MAISELDVSSNAMILSYWGSYTLYSLESYFEELRSYAGALFIFI